MSKTAKSEQNDREIAVFLTKYGDLWLRERDLNPRPPGYEPDELPNCSIPRCLVFAPESWTLTLRVMSPTSYRTALSRDIVLSKELYYNSTGSRCCQGGIRGFFAYKIRGYPTIYQMHSRESVTAPKIIQMRMDFLPVR